MNWLSSISREERSLCDCPQCGRPGATRVADILIQEVFDPADFPKDGHWGDHPWEYGAGVHLETTENGVSVECSQCSALEHGDVIYAALVRLSHLCRLLDGVQQRSCDLSRTPSSERGRQNLFLHALALQRR